MFRPLRPLSSLVKQHYSLTCTRYVHSAKPAKTSKPLRILFCGSDKFSIAGLNALHAEHKNNPESIASIDVVCRPGKRTGRGLSKIREVPIKAVATELGLPVHERDTFTGWAPPTPQGEPINLVVAVSFGLLVPPRIINGAEYGGINVHPSLLPDLHGPAPLQRALIAGDRYIGVSLQTLHPSKFDQGKLLDQTPSPGYLIPKDGDCTVSELVEFITPKAAGILLKGVQNKVFVPPVYDFTPEKFRSSARHAPKITPKDQYVDLFNFETEDILRKQRVIGRLWTTLCLPGGYEKRTILHDITWAPTPENIQERLDFYASYRRAETQPPIDHEFETDDPPYAEFIDRNNVKREVAYMRDNDDAIIIASRHGKGAVRIEQVTVAGGKSKPAFQALFHDEKKEDLLQSEYFTSVPDLDSNSE